MAGSPVAAETPESAALLPLATVAPFSGSPVLPSVTTPSTRPPLTGTQLGAPITTLSSSQMEPDGGVSVSRNRTSTADWPAAWGTGRLMWPSTPVLRTALGSGCQTVVHV